MAISHATRPQTTRWLGLIPSDLDRAHSFAQETEHDELYLIRSSGEGLHQLTKTGHDVSQFEWSPDGNQLAVIFNRNGAFDLSLIETESGSVSDIRSGAGVHSNPNWSGNGTFTTYEYESPLLPPDLYRIDIQSGQVTQLTFSNPLAMQRNKLVVPEMVSTLLRRDTPILRQTTAAQQATVRNLNAPIIMIGELVTRRTVYTARGSCAAPKVLKWIA